MKHNEIRFGSSGTGCLPRMRAALVAVVACVSFAPLASAQVRMPRVYGPGGHLYGRTQAAYQYQRQYGRPWHGMGGTTVVRSGVPFGYRPVLPGYGYGVVLPGYPAVVTGGYTGPNYTTSMWGYPPLGPIVSQPFPQYYGTDPFQNSVIQGTIQENATQWGQPEPVAGRPEAFLPPKPSTPDAKLKSLHYLVNGNEWFRKQNYLQAYARYKKAATAAPDLAEPRVRMGYCLASMGRYESAVAEFKRALLLDRGWVLTGDSLETIFGPDGSISRTELIRQVASWVEVDIRDPDRLFLLGVMLHFNRDADQAETVFETAARLGNSPNHVMAFLDPPELADQPPASGDSPQAQQGPVLTEPPQPVE